METIIEIKGIEAKESNSGTKFTQVKTQLGTTSCFEEDIVKQLKQCDLNGMNAKVNLVESEKNGKIYKNIRGFIEAVAERGDDCAPIDTNHQVQYPTQKSVVPGEFFKKKEATGNGDRSTTMYVSYAKDVYIAGLKADANSGIRETLTMEEAIKKVKQARDAFS